MNVVEAEVRGVLKRDGYAEIVGEIFEAEERKGEFSQPKKQKTKNQNYSMPIVHENVATLHLCFVLHDLNSKSLGRALRNTFWNTQHFSCCIDSGDQQAATTFLSEEPTLNTSSISCHS